MKKSLALLLALVMLLGILAGLIGNFAAGKLSSRLHLPN